MTRFIYCLRLITQLLKYKRDRKQELTEEAIARITDQTEKRSYWIGYYRSLYREVSDECQRSIDHLQNECRFLALGMEVPRGDRWNLWRVVKCDRYKSVGYSNGAAKLLLQKAQKYEVPCRLVTADAGFELWVKGQALTSWVLNFKPEIELEVQVQWCWSQGLDPRVYFPWLPETYERSRQIKTKHNANL